MSIPYQASCRLDHFTPLGKIASGERRMSMVGVTANLASRSSGPTQTTTSRTSRTTWMRFHVRRTRGRRQSATDSALRSAGSPLVALRWMRAVCGGSAPPSSAGVSEASGSGALPGVGVVVVTRCSSGG